MGKIITALVLGVGGNVSQGILKAIYASQIPVRVVGACISQYSMGLYTVDKGLISPLACSEEFLPWLVKTCQVERVSIILSGVEEVLEVMSRHKQEIERLTGSVCVVSRPEALEIAASKLRTCEWLRSNSFNYPRFARADSVEEVRQLIGKVGFPLIAKPIVGKSAIGVKVVRQSEDLNECIGRNDYILQEYLGDEDSEFTASCYVGSDGEVKGTIILKRALLCGTTYRAEVIDNEVIRKEVERISSSLNALGPCNVQLRMDNSRPVCFEINLRFSGTTPIRARMGFNDVETAIRDFVLKESIGKLDASSNLVALRYWNEIYVKRETVNKLTKELSINNLTRCESFIEDYGGQK